MTAVRLLHVDEINANRSAGVQVDTAVYIGTGATCPIIRVGREAPVYILEGTQTAQVVNVVAELTNAFAGAAITVRVGTGSVMGTSIIRVLNGSFAGAVVSQITSGVGQQATVWYDGVQWKG